MVQIFLFFSYHTIHPDHLHTIYVPSVYHTKPSRPYAYHLCTICVPYKPSIPSMYGTKFFIFFCCYLCTVQNFLFIFSLSRCANLSATTISTTLYFRPGDGFFLEPRREKFLFFDNYGSTNHIFVSIRFRYFCFSKISKQQYACFASL